MTASAKRKMLLFLILSGAALVLIAASLPRLSLKPGIPPPLLINGEFKIDGGAERPPIEYGIDTLFVTTIIILMSIMLVWTLIRAMKGARWKELVRDFARFMVTFVLALALLAFMISMAPKSQPPEEVVVVPLPPPQIVTSPLGTPPTGLTWLVGALLALGAALLGVWFLRSRPAEDNTVLRLGEEAERARQALLTGMSMREVILRCYQQMSSVLQEEQGIERQEYMTTGEFERLLAKEGFPAEPIHQLTGLFDAVRYGRWQPGLSDDQKAIACLEAIVQYSRDRRSRADRWQAGEHV